VLADLDTRIQFGLDELVGIRIQMSPLIARTGEQELPVMETAAACAMLHSFFNTGIEKILKIIALDRDRKIPLSESWRRDLLSQMATATETRPAVITADLVTRLAELLAFRHLFRGASIALMRWDRLSPLMGKVDQVHEDIVCRENQASRSPDGPPVWKWAAQFWKQPRQIPTPARYGFAVDFPKATWLRAIATALSGERILSAVANRNETTSVSGTTDYMRQGRLSHASPFAHRGQEVIDGSSSGERIARSRSLA
jgi:hypothetical protein